MAMHQQHQLGQVGFAWRGDERWLCSCGIEYR